MLLLKALKYGIQNWYYLLCKIFKMNTLMKDKIDKFIV